MPSVQLDCQLGLNTMNTLCVSITVVLSWAGEGRGVRTVATTAACVLSLRFYMVAERFSRAAVLGSHVCCVTLCMCACVRADHSCLRFTGQQGFAANKPAWLGSCVTSWSTSWLQAQHADAPQTCLLFVAPRSCFTSLHHACCACYLCKRATMLCAASALVCVCMQTS